MRRPTLFLLLLFGLPGCTTWEQVSVPSPARSTWSARGALRLTTIQDSRIRGDSAWFAGDTLLLRTGSRSTTGTPRVEVAGLERSRYNAVRTGRIGALLLVTTGIVLFIRRLTDVDIGSVGGWSSW